MHAAEREPLIPSQSPDPSAPIAAMGASMPDPVVTRQPVKNEHVKIESTKAFVEVRAALESLVPQLDARIFVLLNTVKSTGPERSWSVVLSFRYSTAEIMVDCCRSPACHARRR